jgi:hypothetical protein
MAGPSIVVVSRSAKEALRWAAALGDAGYRALATHTAARAVDALRTGNVDGLVFVGSRPELIKLEHLLPDQELPPTLLVTDDKTSVTVRSRGVVSCSTRRAPACALDAFGELLRLVRNSRHTVHATLPLRLGVLTHGKWSTWLRAHEIHEVRALGTIPIPNVAWSR